MRTTLKEYLSLYNINIDDSLRSIIIAIAQGAIAVQNKVSRISIDGMSGATGVINVQGEEVQNLDDEANNIFIDEFSKNGKIAIVGSEETENGIILNKEFGEYIKTLKGLIL